ncbi:MAG: class I SAM-dependent methyltransferase, partial [Pseudomonadota bacterium]
LDFDFVGHFARPSVLHAVRARACDDALNAYLNRHEDAGGIVVALGEGLETQLWRVGDSHLRHWISIDLPEAIAVRKALLPASTVQTTVPCSALDDAWIDAVPPGGPPPFISALGLLMYFEPREVQQLLAKIAKAFPGAELYFDTIGPASSAQSLRGWQLTRRYRLPAMPWGISVDTIPQFIRSVPGLAPIEVQTYAAPFPSRTRVYRLLARIPWIRNRFAPSLVHARVGPENEAGSLSTGARR